jgi:hypothetical protein
VALGAGAAGLVGAGIFELLRRDAESDARAERERPSHNQVADAENLERIESRQSAARISLGVGSALLVTGAVLWLVDERATHAPTTSAGFALGPRGVSAAMTTRF